MRVRAAVVAAVSLALAPAAHAACPVSVSVNRGAAPLRVTFHAGCNSSKLAWRFGDGAGGHGRIVHHTYSGGRFRPALTSDAGTHPVTPVTSVSLAIAGPAKADYGQTVTFHATVKPDVPVYLAGQRFHHGALTMTVTQPFLTAVAGPAVVRKSIVVKPRLDVSLAGPGTIGARLSVVACSGRPMRERFGSASTAWRLPKSTPTMSARRESSSSPPRADGGQRSPG